MLISKVTTGSITDSVAIDTDTLVVDGTNNRVSIGTSTPNGTLHVRGSSAKIILEGTNNSGNTEHYLGTSGSSEQDFVIQAGSDTLLMNSDYMLFKNTAGSSEHMRIDSSGNVGIGTTTNTTHSLFIHDSDYQQLGLSGTRPTIFLKETDGNADENYQIRVQNGNLQFETQNDAQTGSTDRVRIDSSGRVTMPYQPAFSVKYSTGVTFSVDAIMVFNSDPVNIGNHYNTSTGLFTAPVAGTYLFSWQLLSQDTANNYCYSALTINSTKLWYNQMYQTTGVDTGISSSGTVSISLSANDTVGVFAFGANTAFYGGSSGNYTWFSGVLLG